MEIIKEISLDLVNEKIRKFKDNERNGEKTLQMLFDDYTDNSDFRKVMAKTIVLDHIYSTRIRYIDMPYVAQNIVNNHKRIDELLRSGKREYELYKIIAYINIDGVYNAYSFATKYLSFINKELYPIMDSYSRGLLKDYREIYPDIPHIKGENNYLLGEVYYNETYQKICNRGGNNNSIGIEISMAKGENLFVNLARCAKLVVKLLKENKLLMSDIKQHHFFSGKNCPQTLRENELWDYFLHLIDVEAIVDSYLSDGYKLSIETKCEYVNENGSIDKLPGAVRGIEYIVTTEYQGKKETALFVKLI